MFEARLTDGSIFKKVIDALKDLVTEAQFECSNSGISLQAMDMSHVSLVSLLLRSDGFDLYRCDRNITMGFNMVSMAKIFRCANSNDIITIKAEDDADVVTFVFESEDGSKVSEYSMKLMDIDVEHLGIPEQQYAAVVKMPSAEFKRICGDMTQISESVTICCTKDGIRFSATGDLGTGNVRLSQSQGTDGENAESSVVVDLEEPVALSFSLKYLNYFTRASPLCNQVSISMAPDVPVVVEYKIGEDSFGYMRFYLAPKIDESENDVK